MFMTKAKHRAVVADYENKIGVLNDLIFARDESVGILRRKLIATEAELAPLKAAKEARVARLAQANAKRAKEAKASK